MIGDFTVKETTTVLKRNSLLLWPPYVIGGHYIFALWFLSIYLSFFARLISAAGD